MTNHQPPGNYLRAKQRIQFAVDAFRHRLAYIDALPQLTFLGLITGMAAALVIVAFRLLIAFGLNLFLPEHSENFEALTDQWHFWLPFLGAVAVGLGMQTLQRENHQVSVGHVLDRLHNHQAQLPLLNWLVQFFGGALCLISGQSVGREGPAVHLGAGAASQLGQWLKLPNNSLHTLVGCGVAAAIATSFNTPMAGVIFAMEVVLMEYTIAGFLPVILASVSGAAIAQAVFGEGIAFSINVATTETAIRSIHMTSLWELPYIALAGVVVAVFAALIIRLQLLLCRFQHLPIALRLSLAGLISGAVALYIPHIMGVGYDTVKAAIFGDLGLNLLLLIIAAKLFVTATGIGLGMPGGIIGPTLVIGACLGGVLEIVGNTLSPLSFDGNIDTGIYVLLGMSAMMAAVLNAPLAALMAVLELTYNPNMIFPTMLIIVIACITTRQVFGCEGIFLAQLAAAGRSVQFKPLFQVLRRAGVRSVMDTRFVCSSQMISYDEAKNVLSNHPMWVVVEELNKDKYLLRATDLAAYLDQASEQELALEKDIDLLEIPARRYKPLPIHQQANLYEAQKLLQKGAEALYVERLSSPLTTPVMGIVTHSTIDNYYQV